MIPVIVIPKLIILINTTKYYKYSISDLTYQFKINKLITVISFYLIMSLK